MGTISSSVGLISGINTGAIITGLLNLDSAPVSLLQTRIKSDANLNATYGGLGSQLSTLQTTVHSLEQASTFQAATANSSNPAILTATAANGAAVGNYSLRVAQLVTTQQLISTGFTSPTTAPVGAGTITIEEGGGGLATKTTLASLNGGAGVGRGQFRVTDRSGASSVIDTSSAVTLDDVVNNINTATNISVRASIVNNHLLLTDTSGKTTSNLIVQDLGTGTSAANLGITANVAATTVTGTTINYVSTNTLLAQLNDGRGITLGTGGGDFNIVTASGATVSVNLATAKTVGDVISTINAAAGTKVTASIPAGSSTIKLVDNTTGVSTTTINATNGSQAATGLGFTTGAQASKTVTGKAVLSGIDSSLLTSLNGGSGVTLGSISVTDKAGHVQTLSFANATSVQDVLDTINSAATVKLKASLKSSGNGIQITDVSGGAGSLTIADSGGGTTSEQLGINGTFANATSSVQGVDLKKQWVTNSTLLSSLNGGKGISKTQFTVTNSTGASTTIDLSGANVNTVGDLLYQINSKSLTGVTASINAAGNGIQIKDTSTGASKLTVADTTGTAAADLNLAGVATTNTIDGAYEKTLTVSANDTLSTLVTQINSLNFGVQATIINDGSATAPYRLSLTADNSGSAGAVTIDGGTTNLGLQTLVAAQDAAVFVGSSNSQQPLLITSSTNQVANVIQGVTLNLQGVSSSAVQLNVSQDTSGISKSLSDFVTTFNSVTDQISSQSTFNTSTNVAGLLLGDSVAASITSSLYNSLNTVVGSGSVRVLAQLGITVGDGGDLKFNQDAFNIEIATNPDAVEQLFHASSTVTNPDGTTTVKNTGVAYAIDRVLSQLIDPVSGSVTAAKKELTAETQGFTDQITRLNALLAQKKSQLENQFANMESVLAGLQSQQTSLSSISSFSSTSSSKSSG